MKHECDVRVLQESCSDNMECGECEVSINGVRAVLVVCMDGAYCFEGIDLEDMAKILACKDYVLELVKKLASEIRKKYVDIVRKELLLSLIHI